MDVSYLLPKDYLSGPYPAIRKEIINFKQTNVPEYAGLYACILDNVLTASECSQLIKAAEARTNGKWEQAMINVGGNQQRIMTDVRTCGRIMWDDRDIVSKIWARCEPLVPEIHKLNNQPKVTETRLVAQGHKYELTRLNERMRFLKYEKGSYFRREPHT